MFPSLVGPMGPPGGQALYVENYDALRALDTTTFTPGYLANVGGHTTYSDGGGGVFYYDPVSVSADNDGTVLEPNGGVGRWFRQFSGPMDVRWFGIVGGGADDSAGVQRAIDAASFLWSVWFPEGDYVVGDIALVDGSRLIGDQARLLAVADSVTVLIVPDSAGGLQTSRPTQVSNLRIDGNSKNDVQGISVLLGSVSNANFQTSFVTVENCFTGMRSVAAQFGTHYRLKFFQCGIGLYASVDPTFGGGSSNSYYDLQAIQCDVGVFISGAGAALPSIATYFRNATLIGNAFCGLAVLNAKVVLDGSANEANGSDGGIYTRDTLQIPSCSVYLVDHAQVSYINSYNAEATVDPCVKIENYSNLTLENVQGYGNINGRFVSADASSTCQVGSNVSTNGVIEGAAQIFAMNAGNGGGSLMLGPSSQWKDDGIPNESATPQLGDFADANGTVSNSILYDAVMGECREVAFGATISNNTLNRTLWTPTLAESGFELIVLNIHADRDCLIRVTDNNNGGAKTVMLRQYAYYRLVWFRDGATAGAQQFQIQTADTSAPIIRFSGWQIFSGTDNGNTRALMSRMSAGAYNSKVLPARPNDVGAAAPAAGTWARGQVVLHSAPASGGNIGWVCTTAGTPGTWKAWGTIA